MDTELWAIIHDAVKIGLGALIGGGFSVGVMLLNTNRVASENLASKRRDHLRELTRRFSVLHTIFFKRFSSLSALLDPDLAESTAPEEDEEFKKLFAEVQEEWEMEGETEFLRGLLELHELEAELCLLGAPEISETMEAYRNAVTWATDYESGDSLDGRESAIISSRAKLMVQLMKFYKEG